MFDPTSQGDRPPARSQAPEGTAPTRAEQRGGAAAVAGGPRRRILIVDDNVDMTRSLAMLLEILGHEVITADNGPDAIAIAKERRPEFILLDISLPIMNGYQVAARLREDDPGKSAVIVAVSGYGQEDDRYRSRDAGFDHRLIKPLEHNALLAILAAGKRSSG